MRYAGIIKNDVANGEDVCVTLFVQGCDVHCKGCHNPETWNFRGGEKYTPLTEAEILQSINKNGVNRNLCIMGGEPLCDPNAFYVYQLICKAKQLYPNIKIFIWSGHTYEELKKSRNEYISGCLEKSDVLIDGPFIEELRDITLPMRGSKNQRIIDLTNPQNYVII